MGMMGHGHKKDHGRKVGQEHDGAAAFSKESRGQSRGYALIAVVYLLGLIMGALDMSIVNPARTVIQNTMSVNDALGVWVITIFFPQFCENAMMMKSGSGGYFIAILGIGTAIGSMGSGRLIDKHGVKPILGAGFVGAAVGSLFMVFVACEYPNLLTVCLSMFLSGAGLGFTMGTPLNYMMLNNTDDVESNSALATMSLVRSIGTAVAPAIMVAFIVHASVGMQDNLMDALPKQVSVSPLPYAAQIDQKLDDMRADEETAEMLEGLDIPRLSDYQTIEV